MQRVARFEVLLLQLGSYISSKPYTEPKKWHANIFYIVLQRYNLQLPRAPEMSRRNKELKQGYTIQMV